MIGTETNHVVPQQVNNVLIGSKFLQFFEQLLHEVNSFLVELFFELVLFSMNAENSFHSVELFLKILDDFKTVTNCFDFYPEELIGYELFTDVGLQTEVQELLFCVELAFILVVNFFVLFFLLV